MQAQAVLARRRARGAAESLGDRGRRVMDLLPVELLPARRGAVVEADVTAGAAAASQRNPPAVALRTQATKIYMFTLSYYQAISTFAVHPVGFRPHRRLLPKAAVEYK